MCNLSTMIEENSELRGRIKSLYYDSGWSFEKIASTVNRSEEYVKEILGIQERE